MLVTSVTALLNAAKTLAESAEVSASVAKLAKAAKTDWVFPAVKASVTA